MLSLDGRIMKGIAKKLILICLFYLSVLTVIGYTTRAPKKPSKPLMVRYITNWGKYKLPKVVHVRDLTQILERVAQYRQLKHCPFKNPVKCLKSDLDTIIAKIVEDHFSTKAMNDTQGNETTSEINKNNKKITTTVLEKKQREKTAEQRSKKNERIGDFDYSEEPYLNYDYGNKKILKLELVSMPSKKHFYRNRYDYLYEPSSPEDLTRKRVDARMRHERSRYFKRSVPTRQYGCDSRRKWIGTVAKTTTNAVLSSTPMQLS